MKNLLWVVALASCATSPEAPSSSAMLSGATMVDASHAAPGQVFYGAPYHRWTITLSTTDGCAGEDAASVEINTLSGDTALPTGTVAMRTTEADITALPSAYLRYMGATVSSGSITIDPSTTGVYVVGSFTAQATIAGTPTTLTATFGAPTCP